MNILYIGSACDKKWFDNVLERKAMPYNIAQYRFEMALLNGFAELGVLDIKIYYLCQESYYPKGHHLWIKSRKERLNEEYSVIHISGVNLPIIKEIYNFICGLFLTFKWGFINRNKKDKIILTPFQYTPFALGILVVSKIFKIKRANIFTDLSADIINEIRQKEMMPLKRLVLPYYKKLVHRLETSYDIYILFTEAMKEKVNTRKKPFLVMEGIFSADEDLSKSNKERAIMYAGTISYEYGIKLFLDAFEKIREKNLQLWLFGDGDMREYIHDLCRRDNRVIYFGFRSFQEVFEYEKKATLLINTRNPADEYTKYSFPSKTFEYMVSGTPFLTTRIDGIPMEYYQYLYVIEDYDVESTRRGIEKVLAKPQNELDDFGRRAREFVLQNKNDVIQVGKVIEMMKTVLEGK